MDQEIVLVVMAVVVMAVVMVVAAAGNQDGQAGKHHQLDECTNLHESRCELVCDGRFIRCGLRWTKGNNVKGGPAGASLEEQARMAADMDAAGDRFLKVASAGVCHDCLPNCHQHNTHTHTENQWHEA